MSVSSYASRADETVVNEYGDEAQRSSRRMDPYTHSDDVQEDHKASKILKKNKPSRKSSIASHQHDPKRFSLEVDSILEEEAHPDEVHEELHEEEAYRENDDSYGYEGYEGQPPPPGPPPKRGSSSKGKARRHLSYAEHA